MGDNMLRPLDPFRFLLIAVAGWMNQRQLQIIDYLREENRVLREQLSGRRLRLSDDQRRRLEAKAKVLGRRILAEVATIVTPETPPPPRKTLIQARQQGNARPVIERALRGFHFVVMSADHYPIAAAARERADHVGQRAYLLALEIGAARLLEQQGNPFAPNPVIPRK